MNSHGNRKRSVLYSVTSAGTGKMIRSKAAGGWQRRTEVLCQAKHDAPRGKYALAYLNMEKQN